METASERGCGICGTIKIIRTKCEKSFFSSQKPSKLKRITARTGCAVSTNRGYPALASIDPSSLPRIDAVEVVSLRGLHPNRVSEYMAAAKEARRVRITGTEAQRFAELWRALPEGGQMRCHVPPFGLRFFAGDDLVCEASICWRCNNIFGQAGADGVFFEFDGSFDASRELLKACEGALSEPAAE